MEIELLVGAASFPLEEEDAWWLVHLIRMTCVDASNHPLDADALHCLQLADVLSEDLVAGESPEPIELGRAAARGLTEHVLSPANVAEHDLERLFEALLRLR